MPYTESSTHTFIAPFFSIIIPVYNGLSHDLEKCLDSIWTQDIDTTLYEVICVDDVSPDSSYEWLVKQQVAHPNLKVIRHKENLRQGGARNTGVSHAEGVYILFIDQDDYYHPGSLKQLYGWIQKSETSLDVVITDSAFQFKNNPHNRLQLNFGYQPVMSNTDAVKNLGWCIAPWRLCIRRSFYQEADINFVDKVMIEDIDWGVKVMYYAKTVQYVPLLLIHYNKGDSSTTDNMYHDINILTGNTLAARRVYDLAESLYIESPIKKWVLDLADKYFNYTCRYCFGLYCPIKENVKLLSYIPMYHTKYILIEYAQNNATLFSIITNLSVPLFRIMRRLRRNIKSKS